MPFGGSQIGLLSKAGQVPLADAVGVPALPASTSEMSAVSGRDAATAVREAVGNPSMVAIPTVVALRPVSSAAAGEHRAVVWDCDSHTRVRRCGSCSHLDQPAETVPSRCRCHPTPDRGYSAHLGCGGGERRPVGPANRGCPVLPAREFSCHSRNLLGANCGVRPLARPVRRPDRGANRLAVAVIGDLEFPGWPRRPRSRTASGWR